MTNTLIKKRSIFEFESLPETVAEKLEEAASTSNKTAVTTMYRNRFFNSKEDQVSFIIRSYLWRQYLELEWNNFVKLLGQGLICYWSILSRHYYRQIRWNYWSKKYWFIEKITIIMHARNKCGSVGCISWNQVGIVPKINCLYSPIAQIDFQCFPNKINNLQIP